MKFLKLLLLITACLLSSVLIVWPLWKFSTSASDLYSILLLILLAAGLLFLIIRKVIKTPVKKTVKFLVNILLVFAGLFFTVYFVLTNHRLFALLALSLAALLAVAFNLIFSRIKHE